MTDIDLASEARMPTSLISYPVGSADQLLAEHDLFESASDSCQTFGHVLYDCAERLEGCYVSIPETR